MGRSKRNLDSTIPLLLPHICRFKETHHKQESPNVLLREDVPLSLA